MDRAKAIVLELVGYLAVLMLADAICVPGIGDMHRVLDSLFGRVGDA